MSKREEFIDKTDRRKIPKLSYSIEYICDRIVDWYYHVETTKIAKLLYMIIRLIICTSLFHIGN